LAGTVKITQDRRLLFGEADFAALWIEQNFALGRKRVGSMANTASSLASCCAVGRAFVPTARQSETAFDHVVIGTGFQPENCVGIGVMAVNMMMGALNSALAQDAHGLPAIDIRQSHIHDDKVDRTCFGSLDAFGG